MDTTVLGLFVLGLALLRFDLPVLIAVTLIVLLARHRTPVEEKTR